MRSLGGSFNQFTGTPGNGIPLNFHSAIRAEAFFIFPTQLQAFLMFSHSGFHRVRNFCERKKKRRNTQKRISIGNVADKVNKFQSRVNRISHCRAFMGVELALIYLYCR